MSELIRVAYEVADALAQDAPVVALETSIIGQGLSHPYNLRTARESEAAIREEGAVPATVGVLDGQLHIGLTDAEIERLAEGAIKVSSRDLGWALAHGEVGATTVAATIRAAALAGIRFFATGGIGGVHRGHREDQSADLVELSRTRVAVFCAGAKIILDLALTLERLESLTVPVLGYGCDEFPAFYSRSSGCPLSSRVDGPQETARVLAASWETGARGVVVAIPPPDELEGAEDLVQRAVRELADVSGPKLTPQLLARVAELSNGRSLGLNVDLVVNNARVAARVASAFSELRKTMP